METSLKENLILIADSLTPESTLQDVYEQLSLLDDIETSEKQEAEGQVISHSEVQLKSKEWLR